jgi:hypothetical protein
MSCDEELDLEGLARNSPHFRRRVVELASGAELRIVAAPWRDAIVFVETGEVELECVAGGCGRFAAGAVLCLVPPVSVLRSCGRARARLLAISRRTPVTPERSG